MFPRSHYLQNTRASKISQISIRSISYKKTLPQTSSLSTRTPLAQTNRDQFTKFPQTTTNMNETQRVFHFGQTLPYFNQSTKQSENFCKTGCDFGFGNVEVNGLDHDETAEGVKKTWLEMMKDKREKYKPEKQEQLNYQFKLPVLVQDFEEEGCTIHFMQCFIHGIELVEKTLLNAKQDLLELKTQKENLQKEVNELKINQLKEMANIEKEAKLQVQQFRSKIKGDFIKKQNHNYYLSKELALLQREKAEIINNLKIQQEREQTLEKRLQGVEVYNLQIQDPVAKELINQQLRNSSFKVV